MNLVPGSRLVTPLYKVLLASITYASSSTYVLLVCHSDVSLPQKITRSLGTSDLREAHVLGTQAGANALQGFENKRRSLRPQVISHITAEMTDYVATEISRLVALVDDVVRDNPELAAELLRATSSSSLIIPTANFSVSAAKFNSAHLSRFAGLSDELADAWAQNNKSSKEFADRLMAKRDLTYIYELTSGVTATIGLNRPGYKLTPRS